MDEVFDDEAEVGADWAGLIGSQIASIGEDWDVVTSMLPAQWQAKAVELGAVRRLRGFASVEALLRVLLIHLADGCSLRETVARARAGDLADVSDVALLKRLRGCGPWFQWMAQELAASMSLLMGADTLLAGRRVRRWQLGVRARRDGVDLEAALRAEPQYPELRRGPCDRGHRR